MSRETCEQVQQMLTLRLLAALLRGGVQRGDIAKHLSEEEWQIAARFEWGANDGQTDRLIPVIQTPEYQTYGERINGHATMIRCRACGSRSYNDQDVLHLYCGRCKRFHQDTAMRRNIENAPLERLVRLLDLGAAGPGRYLGVDKGAIEPREARTPIEPPPADSIEMLLHHHPQTLNLSPFALGVQRSLRSPIE